MAYSKELYKKVSTDLEESRQRAYDIAETRRQTVFTLSPSFAEIENEQSQLGLSLTQEILNHQGNPLTLTEHFQKRNIQLQEEKQHILEALGFPANFLVPPFSCMICEDTGTVNGKRCTCYEKRLKEGAFQEINQLSHLSLCSFENFSLEYYSDIPDQKTGVSPRKKMEETLKYCEQYASHFSTSSRSLLLIGQTGLGKTHLSLSIARGAIEKGFGVIYGSAPNLISKVEKEKFEQNRNMPSGDTMALLQHCDLLVLDDLGTEFQTKFTTSAIYDLLNTRLNLSLPTIVSTNLSLKELEDAYTPRILSRITGFYKVIPFVGQDIRSMIRSK